MIAITVMLPMLIVIVDTTVVNVSLDHIRGSLSAGIEESTWVITSFLASTAIIIPMSGWVSVSPEGCLIRVDLFNEDFSTEWGLKT